MPASGTAAASGMNVPRTLVGLWLGGCGLMLARLVFHGTRLMRRSRPLPRPMAHALEAHCGHLGRCRIRLHPAGPAVCWIPRCRLLLPADLLERFDAHECRQILAHERMHLARLDPLWSLLAELTLAMLWFFPPAWLAMPRFRLDQELACDAAILAHQPDHAGIYARTLLASATDARATTLTTAWLSRRQLRQRLAMIHTPPRPPLKRHGGYAALVILLAGTALAAHATLPATTAKTASATKTDSHDSVARSIMSYRIQLPPRYPEEAIKHRHQGTAVVLVLVGTDGEPLKTRIDTSSGHESLDQAAVDAVMQWHFNPGTRDGEPYKGWARVPIDFRLNDQDASDTGKSSRTPAQDTSDPQSGG